MLALLCHSLRYSPVPTQLASVDALLITFGAGRYTPKTTQW